VSRSSALQWTCVFLWLTPTLPLAAADQARPLFPTPIHLTRTTHDPFLHQDLTVEQYAMGDRLITVAGEKTSIADYRRGELTEIDRQHGTYSITRFEQLAPLNVTKRRDVESADAWQIRALPSDAPGHRGSHAELHQGKLAEDLDIVVDDRVTLSREGFEVLTGSAWPGVRRPIHRALERAASRTGDTTTFSLPIEQRRHVVEGGETIELREAITRIGSETPPAAALEIPRGAVRVDSWRLRAERELHDLDTLPARERN
jgi:hypothetical protein